MAGFLSRLILKGVVRSALVLEAESIATYQALRGNVGNDRSCSDALDDNICHLLAEEEMHRKILQEAADGKLTLAQLEKLLAQRSAEALSMARPLDPQALARWGEALSSALEHEEKTWIFYSNLRRMSRVPSVKKAFEALATMEKQHVDILRSLLGLPSSAGSAPHPVLP
jgi:rubrerythrin